MKWACRRCSLQRDDRRGSNCNGVKGQGHDWIAIEDYLNELSQYIWKNWLKTTSGVDFTKEKKRIENEYEQAVEPLWNSDIMSQIHHHNSLENFFEEKRIIFVGVSTIIPIVCAFLFKSFIFIFFALVIAGFVWLVFFILEKIHSNKSSVLYIKYTEMKQPYIDKREKEETKLVRVSVKLLNEFMHESDRIKKLNTKEIDFVRRNLYDIITGQDDG
jgi:hypothetical protein